ncbi:hypothetical protein GYH30_003470 [Glycine max]|uniref:ATP-dependent DNA ligase family profile domain-containing protein n=1 Tax=Glycine max TaxID=3847 RepID=K7K7A3_SOYBN|nr:hypothetical protein GYH30_003470 [Glycine max]
MLRTIFPALAHAIDMNSCPTLHQEGTAKNIKDKLQVLSMAVVEAYNILPNLDLIVPCVMNKGIDFSVSSLSMVPGITIKPMLEKITNGIPQALKLFENKAFTCEYKYDGQRAQIHKLVDGSICVFSRNGGESTSRFPDLIDIFKGSSKSVASTFIMDAEIVDIDRKNGYRIMSFQVLSSRRRGGKDTLVDICIFVFDIMFANGEHPFKFCFQIEVDDACLTYEATLTKINAFLEDALCSSCEGILVKTLDVDAGYSPSKHSDKWLKVNYVEGLNDTLYLVPIGAWHENGRKAGWYSPFLMACFNPEAKKYQSVCCVMSRFSDSFYRFVKLMKELFSRDKVLSKKPPYYQTGVASDMWFCPQVVWEIRGAYFTVSLGLICITDVKMDYFLHLKKMGINFCASDRSPKECSAVANIVEMFHSQTRKMDATAGD